MLDLQSTGPSRLSRFMNGVRIGSAPVGQGSLTWRLSCIGAAGLGLIFAAGQSQWRAGVVSGRSMEPGLRSGNVFLFRQRKPAEKPKSLHAGDVVVLHRQGETWIKRVYATAGEKFWVLRELDGEHRMSRPIRAGHEARFINVARFMRAQGQRCEVVQLQVPPGKVFVIGDGVGSRDSRELGPVWESEVVGEVVAAAPGGLTEMPEWVELSFPSRATFARYNAMAPPSVLKRDAQHRRAVAARRAMIRHQPATGSAA